jgi:hypothetical protein
MRDVPAPHGPHMAQGRARRYKALPDKEAGTVVQFGIHEWSGPMTNDVLLKYALILFGAIFLLVYPLAIVWPSGWAWHSGAPYTSDYFMMIVGVYATLGVFLIRASANPQAHRSLIWFTVWSSLVHAVIMAVQSMTTPMQQGHMMGDVPGLIVAGIVLAVLMKATEKQTALGTA